MPQHFQPNIDFDNELECAVLGCCLIEPDAFGRIHSILIPECFYNPANAEVYNTFVKLFDEGWALDYLMIQRRLYDERKTQLGDSPTAYYISTLVSGVISTAHVEQWCVKLRELAIRRTAIRITNSGIDTTADVLDIAGDIEAKLKQLMDLRSTDDWQDASKVAMRLFDQIEATQRGDTPSITTSLREIDNLNGGFKAGQLILLGARPAVGKSAFMGRMAIKAAKMGKRVGIISLEMENTDVFARMVSFDTTTPFWRMDKAEFFDDEHFQEAIKHISNTALLPIHFSDKAQVNMRDIRAKAEKLRKKHGLDILFIDYLQLVESDSAKNSIREQEVARISKGSKLLARLLKIPIVMLVQLNRQADGEEPQLKHLRESGTLEQDADVVLMLYRDTDTEDPMLQDKATLFVRKWRNGSTPRIELKFIGEHMRFSEDGEVDVFEEPVLVEKPKEANQWTTRRALKDIKAEVDAAIKAADEPPPF